MADIGEKIFEAVDVIVQKRLSGLEFDKTIVGTIESVKGVAEEGKENTYIVNDGSTKYTVYSKNVYRVNTSVYVSIPNGDYTQKKFIVGYNLGESEIQETADPDSFVDITGPVWSMDGELSLLANEKNSATFKDIVWTKNPPIDEQEENAKNNIYPIGYTQMKIGFDIRTELGDTQAISGDYGLNIALVGWDKQGAVVTTNFSFNTSNFFGDPYKFDGWWPHEDTYNLENNNINIISGIIVEFYQNGEFRDSEGNLIPHSFDGQDYDPNLFIRNINISFGYGKSELVKGDNLLIYSNYYGQRYYSDRIDNTESIAHARYIRWDEVLNDFASYNDWNEAKEKIKEISGFNDKDAVFADVAKEPKVEWYLQKTKEIKDKADTDILTQSNLLKINSETFVTDLSNELDLNESENKIVAAIQYIDYKKALEKLPENYEDAEDDIKEAFLKMCAITAQSNLLSYVDEAKKDADTVIDRATGIYLEHIGNNNGRYHFYLDGRLINIGEKSIDRIIIPRFKKAGLSLKPGDIVTWYVPVSESTMIDISHYDTEVEDGVAKIVLTVANKEGEEEVDPSSYQLVYRIKEYYTPLRDANNTITCKVDVLDGTHYDPASIELSFGTSGTMGTNYGIEVKLEREYTIVNDKVSELSDKNILYAIPSSLAVNNWVKVTAELHHATKIISTQPTFTWEWLDEDVTELKLYITDIPSTENYIRWKEDKNISTKSILKVSCKVDDLKIVEYFPVPSKLDSDVYALEGSDKIVYAASGALKYFYSSPYNLLCNEKWDNFEYIINENNFLSIEKNILKPEMLYSLETPNVQCLQIKSGNDILWSQPIYIYQDRWPLKALNEWDGNLTIDEKNDIILSAMVGAGKKNDDNSFTGVVMGTIETTKKETGLFGFKQGAETFGFKSDGTAFIGAPTGARIEFDGTNGFIQNADFSYEEDSEDNTGLKIDFVNAEILSPAFQLTQTKGAVSNTGVIAGWMFDKDSMRSTIKDSAPLYLYSKNQLTETEVQNSGKRNDWRIKVGNNFGITSDGTLFSNVLGTISPESSVSAQLNVLSQEHTAIENKLIYIETLSANPTDNTKTEIVTQLTEEKDEKNNPTILGRIVKLEGYKEEPIEYISAIETDTITIDGTEVQIIKNIKTSQMTVLVKS